MKDPKFILRVAGHEFVVPHNRGVAALMALMAEAVPVDARLYEQPPTITLTHDEDPRGTTYLTEVRIERIPRGVRWRRKAADGSVQEVRPVTRSTKQLAKAVAKELHRLNGGKTVAAKALPGRRSPALTNGGGGQQLALGWTE